MEIHIIIFSPKPACCCVYAALATGRYGEKLVFLLCSPLRDSKQIPLQVEAQVELLS